MYLRAIVALAAVALLAACGAKKSGAVTVSAASTSSSSSGGAGSPSTTPAALPAGLQVTEVNVAVRELELDDGTCTSTEGSSSKAASAASSSSGSGSSDDASHGECEAEVGPFIAHLDQAALAVLASGKVPELWTAPLRAGTYTELEVKLCAIEPSALKDPAQAALATAMQGATVVVKGTYQAPGTEAGPVDFTISVPACAEIERHVQVTVDDKGGLSNLTLNVNMAAWFTDAGGKTILPDSPANIAAIAANIAASLDVYGDDDRDGHSDH